MGFVPMAKTLPSVSLRDRLRRMIPDSLCSDEGVDLLCSLLKLNPADRLPIEQVCLHSYFRDCIYDAVMRKEYEGKELFPNVAVLKQPVVLPPLLNDYLKRQRVTESAFDLLLSGSIYDDGGRYFARGVA